MSTKRRNILIASIIIVVVAVASIGAVIIFINLDNVTVSGKALVSGNVVLAATIQKIEFTDTSNGHYNYYFPLYFCSANHQ